MQDPRQSSCAPRPNAPGKRGGSSPARWLRAPAHLARRAPWPKPVLHAPTALRAPRMLWTPGVRRGSRHRRWPCSLRRPALLFLGVACALLALSPSTSASGAPGAPRVPAAIRVVIVLVDALSLRDIDPALSPNLWALASTGAVGLMNARTAKTLQPEHTYVTLGAGTRAQGPPEAGHAFNWDEVVEGAEAAVTLARNTGTVPPPSGTVVHPYIALIARCNSDASYHIMPGALGEALRQAGKRTAVFGNSDTPGHPGRYAAAIAMDSHGVVSVGDVGRAMAVRRPVFPGGIATDTCRLAARVKDALIGGEADLIVVESGDTARVERYLAAGLLTGAAYETAWRFAVSQADTLVGLLVESLDPANTALVVLAPTPAAREVASGHSLAPIVVASPGVPGDPDGPRGPGLLTSPTTRRSGLVASTDIAASVLSWLGVKQPPWILGTPMRVEGDALALDRLLSMHDEIASTYLVRAPILKTFVGFQIVVALAALAVIAVTAMRQGAFQPASVRSLAFHGVSGAAGTPATPGASGASSPPGRSGAVGRGGNSGAGVGRAVWALLFATGCVPLAMLILPLVRPQGLPAAASWLVALSLAIFVAARAACGPEPRSFAGVYLVTGLAIICDALMGARLMQGSVLGYDPIGGARFYGMGNEYMGVLVGSLIAGSGLSLDALRGRGARPAVHGAVLAGIGAIFAAALLVLASPTLGANMGGTLTAVAGFVVAYTLFLGRRVTRREVAVVAALALVLVAGVSVADALRPGGPVSHWGRAARAVWVGGPAALVDIVRRKASMNLKLIRYTVWTRALLAFLGAVAVLWVRPVGLARRLMRAHPGFTSSLAACLVAAAVAILANDSGIVAAALLVLYPSLVLLYLAGCEAE